MSETLKDFETLRVEIVERLNEIKELDELKDENDLLSLTASISSFISKDFSDKELASEILGYQYRQLGSVSMSLYDIMYSASEDTLNKLSFGFSKEVKAFRKYGRTGVFGLKQIVEEED